VPEQAHCLRILIRRQLPTPNSAHVHVDEVGSTVVADPTAMQFNCGIAQLRSRHARYADINCFRLHVQAVSGDTGVYAPRAQKLVGARSAVPAHDINLRVGNTQRAGQLVQQVEHTWIILTDVTRTVVPQVTIEPIEGFWEINVTTAIHDIESFIGMRVVEAQTVFANGGGSGTSS